MPQLDFIHFEIMVKAEAISGRFGSMYCGALNDMLLHVTA